MIDGNVTEFVDNLYYGSEMYFIFRGKRYFIQGWYRHSIHYLVLDYDHQNNEVPEGYKFNGYIWEHQSKDPSECVKVFLDAPLWDGKKFYEVEKEIIWAEP